MTPSGNTIKWDSGRPGNTIAFNVAAGVIVGSGTGDSILSNSIFANGHLGLALLGGANDSSDRAGGWRRLAVARAATSKGRLRASPNTSFPDSILQQRGSRPVGFRPGPNVWGSTTVTTDAGGSAKINFNLSSGLAIGSWATVTATNQSTGDTSAFSNVIAAQPVSIAFSMADFPVDSTAGFVMVDVARSGNLSVAVSVSYATSNGSAISSL